MSNDEKLFYTIGEVADIVQVKPYVLRYWETEFKKLNPQKSLTGQRTYRPHDIQVALTIKKLLYEDKYTIAGAIQKLDEMDSKNELSALKTTPAAPVVSETPVADVVAPAEPEPTQPQHDPQKVKDFRSLIENTKNLLKKYNLL
jgi:DNA-binding transcriptional MerR regulator